MKKILLLSVLLLSATIGFSQVGTNQYYGSGPGGGAASCGGYNMGPPVMSDFDFRRACDAVARQSFDDDKLRIAQQVASGNTMLAGQVRDMTRLLTFESTKLDFAIFAYTRVVDPQNYYVVNDAFGFSSSIRELSEYTSSIGFSGGGTFVGGNGGMNGGGGSGSGGSGSGHGHGHGHGNGNGHGNGHGHNGYVGNQGGPKTVTIVGSGPGMTYSGQVNTVPVAPVMPACGMCSGFHEMNIVCERSFADIAGAVCRQTFERDKLMVAKQAVGGKLVSADQVRRLMGHFTFESTKLDFAKWAYSRCWDFQNYYVVNDAFTFSSSVRELDQFIRMG